MARASGPASVAGRRRETAPADGCESRPAADDAPPSRRSRGVSSVAAPRPRRPSAGLADLDAGARHRSCGFLLHARATRVALVSTRSSCLTSERVPAVVRGTKPCCLVCARKRGGLCAADRAVVAGADGGVTPTSTSGRSSPRAAVARLLRDHLVNDRASDTAIGSGRDSRHVSDMCSKAVLAMMHDSQVLAGHALCARPGRALYLRPGCCRLCP
jgi:hypothetical protein